MTAFSTIGTVICLFWLVWIYEHRAFSVVKMSQPLFCGLFALGGLVCNLSLLALLGKPSDALCRIRPWLQHLPITFTYSCLLVKIFHVWRILKNLNLRKISLTKNQLLLGQVLILLPEVVMIINSSAPTAQLVERYQTSLNREVSEWVCSSENKKQSQEVGFLLIFYKFQLVLAGCYMSWKCRNLDNAVGESKSLMLSSYNFATVGFFLLLLDRIGAVDDNMFSFLQALGMSFCIMFSIMAVFVPKMQLANKNIGTGASGAGISSSAGMSQASLVDHIHHRPITSLKSIDFMSLGTSIFAGLGGASSNGNDTRSSNVQGGDGPVVNPMRRSISTASSGSAHRLVHVQSNN